jgi:hypothetical protein
VFAQWDFPLHYKNKRYVPPIKFVENQNNLGNTSVTHGMTLYRKGKCLGANSLLLGKCYIKGKVQLLNTQFANLELESEEETVLEAAGAFKNESLTPTDACDLILFTILE